MKQLTTYLTEDVHATVTSLLREGESLNGYLRTAVEAENRRRMFAGMDQAIAAVVDPDEAAAWQAANTTASGTASESRQHGAQG